MIGDRVKVGIGNAIRILKDNVPVYSLTEINQTFGVAEPKVIGGVVGGSLGIVVDGPRPVLKNTLRQIGDDAVPALAADKVNMFKIKFDKYPEAWVAPEHTHIIG